MQTVVASIGKRIALVAVIIAALPLAALPFVVSLAAAIVAVPIGEFTKPVYLTAAPGDTSRVFVLELDSGNILIVKDGVRLERPFLVQRGVATGSEAGLFAMAFHPDYDDNGYFYVSYARAGGSAIRRYRVSSNPDIADTTTGVDIIFFPETAQVHFGGWIGFGPDDGYLYIAKGDGSVQSRAQGDSTRFGKILRTDVTSAFPYAIPPDNPRSDAESPMNEFWSTGVRNPWRCSFDRETGDLYIGEVGARTWEEIDFQSASSAGGENYGWPKLEGPEIFDCPGDCDTTGLAPALALFSHDAEDSYCAIVGGYVYRGEAIPELRGEYFLGDLCASLGPVVTSLTIENGVELSRQDRTAELQSGGVTFEQIASFGEDARGELYICDLGSGIVSKIVPDSTSAPPARWISTSVVGPPTPNPTRGGCRFEVLRPAGKTGTIGEARVYDASGRLVRTLRVESQLGRDMLSWDSRDDRGDLVPSGSYLLRIASEPSTAHKVVVIR